MGSIIMSPPLSTSPLSYELFFHYWARLLLELYEKGVRATERARKVWRERTDAFGLKFDYRKMPCYQIIHYVVPDSFISDILTICAVSPHYKCLPYLPDAICYLVLM